MSTSISFRQMVKVYDTLVEQGLNSFDVQEHLLGKGILSDIAEALKFGKIPDRAKFREFLLKDVTAFLIQVNFRTSYDTLVSSGMYDEVDEGIHQARIEWKTSNKVKKTKVKILYIRDVRNFDEARAEIIRRGYRSASVQELLHFGAEYPEVQKDVISVVILGQTSETVEGWQIQFALDYSGQKRRFVRYDAEGVLGNMDHINISDCHFLVVSD